MCSILEISAFLLSIVQFIVIAHIIMSWLINFGVLNMHQQIVAQLWDGLTRILEPIYTPIRNALPNTGGLDLAPLIVILAIFMLQTVIRNNIPAACF